MYSPSARPDRSRKTSDTMLAARRASARSGLRAKRNARSRRMSAGGAAGTSATTGSASASAAAVPAVATGLANREILRLVTLADFDRVPLLFGPSPVHPLPRLGEHLGSRVEIWAKREDCNAGLAYGGNKTRKLEYLAAEALAQGCDTLVSIGGVQSNHTRQVAAVAARLGLGCVLVQEHWVEWPDVVYDKVGNILLSRIMGADVRLDPAGFDIGIRPSWEQALADVEQRGGKPYPIPAGASDHPLGGLGFARWADEVAAQERELSVFFDTVVVCSVTGSTQAGMIAGFAVQQTDRAVLGIDGSATVAQTWAQI